MPVQINARVNSFVNPLGLLSDCHRRIEMFLGSLTRLARDRNDAVLAPGEREALSTALRYFRDAAPKHTADEEESLFPRLRQCGNRSAEALLVRVQALEADHDRADALHREVDALGNEWIASGILPEEKARRLSRLLDDLQTLYQQHIEFEDKELFPLAAQVLTRSEQETIGREMAARR